MLRDDMDANRTVHARYGQLLDDLRLLRYGRDDGRRAEVELDEPIGFDAAFAVATQDVDLGWMRAPRRPGSCSPATCR